MRSTPFFLPFSNTVPVIPKPLTPLPPFPHLSQCECPISHFFISLFPVSAMQPIQRPCQSNQYLKPSNESYLILFSKINNSPSCSHLHTPSLHLQTPCFQVSHHMAYPILLVNFPTTSHPNPKSHHYPTSSAVDRP